MTGYVGLLGTLFISRTRTRVALSPAFFLSLRLLFLAVLESGAPLSSSLEEALYKCSI